MSIIASMPMRIAFYDAFALFEGSGRAMLDILDRLDRDRFEPVVVAPREGDLLGAASARGYEAHLVPASGALTRYNKALAAGGPRVLPGVAFSILRHALRLRGWLRRNRIDLLHCNQTRAALQAGLGGKLAGVPVVWLVRIQDQLPAPATRFGAWCASAVVSLAPSCLDGFEGAEVLQPKLTEIPLGVDTDRFTLASGEEPAPDGLRVLPGDAVVLMVGGLHPRKRHDLLIEAAPRIVERVPTARIVIVGGGFEDTGAEYEAGLKRRCAELGVQERVVFTGRRDDVPAIMRVADVLVLPSDQEGLPGVVIEAMATGLPVVVTPVAAAPVVDGQSGRVIPPGDHAALAEAVIDLLEDRATAKQMGAAARQRAVERYSLDATVRQYEALYERLAGDAGAAGESGRLSLA